MFKRPQEHFFYHLLLCRSQLRGPFSCVPLSMPELYKPQIAPWFLAKSKEKPGHSKADRSQLKCAQERTTMSLSTVTVNVTWKARRYALLRFCEMSVTLFTRRHHQELFTWLFLGSFLLLEINSSFFSVYIEEISKKYEPFSEIFHLRYWERRVFLKFVFISVLRLTWDIWFIFRFQTAFKSYSTRWFLNSVNLESPV